MPTYPYRRKSPLSLPPCRILFMQKAQDAYAELNGLVNRLKTIKQLPALEKAEDVSLAIPTHSFLASIRWYFRDSILLHEVKTL